GRPVASPPGGRAPGPVLACSRRKSSCQGQPLMSDQAGVRMCAPRCESRTTQDGSTYGSLEGCQGRPRNTVASAAEEVKVQPVNRIPCVPWAVAGAAT